MKKYMVSLVSAVLFLLSVPVFADLRLGASYSQSIIYNNTTRYSAFSGIELDGTIDILPGLFRPRVGAALGFYGLGPEGVLLAGASADIVRLSGGTVNLSADIRVGANYFGFCYGTDFAIGYDFNADAAIRPFISLGALMHILHEPFTLSLDIPIRIGLRLR